MGERGLIKTLPEHAFIRFLSATCVMSFSVRVLYLLKCGAHYRDTWVASLYAKDLRAGS